MLDITIIIIFFVCSLLLLYRNFTFGLKILLVLSLLLHKEVFSIYRWDFLPVRIFMGAICIYGLLEFGKYLWADPVTKLRTAYKKVMGQPFILLLVLMWITRGISIINTKNFIASISLYVFFTCVVILGILIYTKLALATEQIYRYIKFYIFLAFLTCLFGFFQLFLYTKFNFIIGALWNVPGHLARVGSTFWDVNHFAAFISALIPIVGVFLLSEKGVKNFFKNGFLLILFTVTLLITSSRTSWLIALVSFIVFVTVIFLRRFGSKGILAIVFTIVLIAIPMFREYSIKSSPFRAYVKRYFHYRLDSFASHIMLLQGSVEIFNDHFLMGGGYGSFFEYFRKTDIAPAFFGRDPAALNTRVPAHTIWGESLSETGLIGFTLIAMFYGFLSIFLIFGALKFKEKKDYLMSSAMFSVVAGIMVAGVFYSYNSEFFWILLFLFYFYIYSIFIKTYTYRELFSFFLQKEKLTFLVIAVISAILIFSGLGVTHLVPWDEAIYAKIASNMALSGDYLNMSWVRGSSWFEKPPFAIWTQALLVNALGFSSLSVRLPSAIFGFLTVIAVYLFSKRYFGRFAGYISGLSLVTTIHFLYYARASMMDVTLTFFITTALFVYFIAKEKNNTLLWCLSGFLVGFAIMTKGAIGIFPLIIIFFNEFITIALKMHTGARTKIMNYLVMILSLLIVTLPWHLYMYSKFKMEFINNYILYHVFDRALTAIEDKGEPFWWYFSVMKVSMRLWFIALLPALPFIIYKAAKKEAVAIFLSIWFIVVFLLFSIAKSKITWYIIPIYPSAAIIVGYFLTFTYNRFSLGFKFLGRIITKGIMLFILTYIILVYLYIKREMVYTSDLTGAQATLLELKDKELGTDIKLYVDRIEVPIVRLYSQSEFEIIDYDPRKGRLPLQGYIDQVNILAKKGRFTHDLSYYGSEPVVVGESGDYILFYYKSPLSIEKDLLRDIQEELKTLKERKSTDYLLIRDLEAKAAELSSRVNAKY